MNTSGQKKIINLKNTLDLTKNTKVNAFTSFKENNSLYFNQALSPFYYNKTENKAKPVYDKEDNRYEYYNGTIYKNNEILYNVTNKGFAKETLNPLTDVFLDNTAVKYSNGYLEAYKDNTLAQSLQYTLSEIQTARVIKAETNYYYVALTEDTILIWDIENNTVTTFDGTTDNETPKIFYNYERYKTPLICVVNKSAGQIKSNELNTVFLVYTSTGWQKATLSQNTGTVITKGTKSITANYSITENKSLENKVAYKNGDKYYDADGNEITFSKGYNPVLVANNEYKYTLYTTEYVYAAAYSDVTNITDGEIIIDISINNPTYEIDNNHPQTVINVGTDKEYTYTLKYENNNGYIIDKGFSNPEIILKCGKDATEYTSTINVKNIKIATDYVNRNGNTVTHNIPYVTESTGATSTYAKYVLIDDGFFYGYSDTYGTWNGTLNCNPVNIVSAISNNTLTITPAYKVWTASTLIPNGYLTAPYSLEINQYCFKWTTVYINSSDKNAGRSLLFDSTCWNKSDHGVWLNNGVNIYTEEISANDSETITNNFTQVTANLQGSRYSEKNCKILYNDGYISGISYSENKHECGTLLTTWNSVDTESYIDLQDDYVVFKQNNNWTKISIVDNPTDIRLIEKRFILINTTDYFNCYDTVLNKMTHYATDWNNRTLGWISGDADTTLHCYVTGENINFSQSDNTLVSTIWPYHSYAYSGYLAYNNVYSDKAEIELYYAENSTPVYVNTTKSGVIYFNSKYIVNDSVLTYPTYSTSNIYINPDYFAEYIQTGVNQDFIVNNNAAYKLYYYNTTTPVLIASTSSYINNMETLFVIQSMAYGIFDNKIYTLTFNNNVYSAAEAIIDITGLKYCGNTPTTAYFYSPANKSFYGFTGDCNLTLVQEASKISNVYGVYYNTATQTICVATDVGLLLIGVNNTALLDYKDVKNIFFSNNGSLYVIDGNNMYQISQDYVEDYDVAPIILDTGLYGSGDNKLLTVDKWKIRLYSEHHLNGSFKILSYILSDEGNIETEENTIEIKSTDWDNLFDTTLISYTPKYNKGVGIGVKIQSDFAISEMIASYTIDNNTQQTRMGL